jgi:hypothetical protein
MKHPVSPEQRQQVIDLRRSHSLAEVASITGLPVGTVKTLVSRSGRFTDNQVHRALFTLPAARPSTQTLPAVPELPPQTRVTGDKEIDAVIWLRAVIDTGNPALIEKAMQAKAKIKTPLAEIEKRYLQHLVSANPGDWTVAFKTFCFADLDGLAASAIQREQLRAETLARFGDGIFAETEAESFCVDTLFGLERSGSMLYFDKAEVAARFRKHTALMPQTLADCLHELKYWNDLYRLRNAVDRDAADPAPEATARDWFVFGQLAEIRPRGKDEAMTVFRYLSDDNRMGMTETESILINLISR